MAMSASDVDLIQRISAGDSTAIQVLYGRHHVKIFRFVMRFVKNEALAEELTNEVFLDVWRQAGRFEGKSAVSTWMLSIGRNKSISLLRKKRDEALDDRQAEQIADHGDDPELAAQKANKGELMRRCIEQLSDEHREVIDLVYYHGKSVKEVAEIVEVSPNTVKTRMFYARKNLSGLLKEAGIDRGWP